MSDHLLEVGLVCKMGSVKESWPTFGCGIQFRDLLPGQAVSNGLLLDAVGHACMPVLNVSHPAATDTGDRVPHS